MQDICFSKLGVMIDCSRNSVLSISSVKKIIDYLSIMGYNTLQLYTEDTYEVNNEPYFGCLRGRYSKDELKEIDKYALSKNIELIPCIQTLAHLNQIFHWPIYAEICDCNDILLVGNDRTYQLIDNIFSTLKECFSSRRVNIGMDEALSLGFGKYLEKNGYKNRSDIMFEHLQKVLYIAEKYGFRCMMWSDMFYKLAYGENNSFDLSDKISKDMPKNIDLIYWDYYSIDKNHYSNILNQTKKLTDSVCFACGAWTWIGLVPDNKYSIKEIKASFDACKEQNIKEVFITMWGDNGGSCSPFHVLPSLFFASEINKGIFDENIIKKDFEKLFGVGFDDFMCLDLPNTLANDNSNEPRNPSKYLFYNDIFLGRLDSTISIGDGEIYKEYSKKLKKAESIKEWSFLFKPLRILCDVLYNKVDLGLKVRQTYKNNDKVEIKKLLKNTFKPLLKNIDMFYFAFVEYWDTIFKPNGFDVMDNRLGGVIQRLKHIIKRLENYVNGVINDIPELDEEILDLYGNGKDLQKKTLYGIDYVANVTINRL